MEWMKNERGFTFISALISIFVLAIFLPFIGSLFQAADKIPVYTEEISIQQSFQFIRDDLASATSCEIEPEKIHLTLHDGTPVTIGKYNDVIRRQVKGKGHEIYLRHVDNVSFKKISYGFQITITSSEGEEYVKDFAFYP